MYPFNIYMADMCIKPKIKFLSLQTRFYQEQNTQTRKETSSNRLKLTTPNPNQRSHIDSSPISPHSSSTYLIVKWGATALIMPSLPLHLRLTLARYLG